MHNYICGINKLWLYLHWKFLSINLVIQRIQLYFVKANGNL